MTPGWWSLEFGRSFAKIGFFFLSANNPVPLRCLFSTTIFVVKVFLAFPINYFPKRHKNATMMVAHKSTLVGQDFFTNFSMTNSMSCMIGSAQLHLSSLVLGLVQDSHGGTSCYWLDIVHTGKQRQQWLMKALACVVNTGSLDFFMLLWHVQHICCILQNNQDSCSLYTVDIKHTPNFN